MGSQSFHLEAHVIGGIFLFFRGEQKGEGRWGEAQPLSFRRKVGRGLRGASQPLALLSSPRAPLEPALLWFPLVQLVLWWLERGWAACVGTWRGRTG